MLRLLLLITLLYPLTPGAPAPRLIHIVYVQPQEASAPLTLTQQAAARASIAEALAFWQDLAPQPRPLTIADERTITASGDIEDSFEWSRPAWQGPPDLTLFVINSTKPLLGNSLAQSQTPLGLIWALRGDGDAFAATIAHELGHVVYGLPHQYQDAGDIMGLAPIVAYQQRFLGCSTLAQLGAPCRQVWLPLIVRSPLVRSATLEAPRSAHS